MGWKSSTNWGKPYLYTPNQLINNDNLFPLANELFEGMGGISNENYSNYPPFSHHDIKAGVTIAISLYPFSAKEETVLSV